MQKLCFGMFLEPHFEYPKFKYKNLLHGLSNTNRNSENSSAFVLSIEPTFSLHKENL